ncbi:pyrroline-5-carboxylate reductase [candidate division KSB1 bacterium]|nr:pyrroline-5-carboxylate reductase [candidate division KSB1 bacterium]
MIQEKIGVIGAGNMGGALVGGLIKAKLTEPANVMVSDVNSNHLIRFEQKWGVKTTNQNLEVVKFADILIMSVKPQILKSVLLDTNHSLRPEVLLISIAAGIQTHLISKWINKNNPIVRAMPNIAAQVDESATAICLGKFAEQQHAHLVRQIFEAVGIVQQIDEAQMNAITGLSGSGPAYIYMIIEALTDGGVKMGLSRDVAFPLAVQTLLGSAKLVQETGMHPAVLRDQVTTPGGTAIAAIHDLETHGLRSMLISAVMTATKRAEELGTLYE